LFPSASLRVVIVLPGRIRFSPLSTLAAASA